MNKLSIFTLKALRKLYAKIIGTEQIKPECEYDPDKASQIIYDALMDDKPCMIARFGAYELNTVTNYLGIKYPNKNLLQFIKGESLPWWWNNKLLSHMQTNAGFFPPTQENIEQFCELMLEDMKEVDVLGSWLENENYFEKELNHAQKVHLRLLEPYWAQYPWTKALAGKKVLIVHPFENEIKQQYQKKELLFKYNILPDFELKTNKAVQSHADEKTPFADWFEALQWMKDEIDKRDYDICLIGAGAYGFHLAAHVKQTGKKAIHLGGALQLLFGIRGKRWEDPNYGVKEWGIPYGYYTELMNEYWVRPNNIPTEASKVEGACYW